MTVAQRQATTPFWRDVRVLAILGQIIFLLLIAVAAGFLYANLSSAMQRRGLIGGFDFLNNEASFEIGESLIPYKPSDSYGTAFLAGIANTLLVSIVGIFLATLIGVLVGVARLSTNWMVNRIAATYVEIIRNTPLLVQLVFIYFAVFVSLPSVRESIQLPGNIFASQRGLFVPRPEFSPAFSTWFLFIIIGWVAAILLWIFSARVAVLDRHAWLKIGVSVLALILFPAMGWNLSSQPPITFDIPVRGNFNFSGGIQLSPEFSAVLTGLVIYTAGFIAEVVRGGILAVKRGQIEAAMAIGLSDGQILRLVTFPQAMRVIIPPLTSNYLNLTKNSSLAIAIGFPDLFHVSSTIYNQTGQPVPVILLVMVTYLAMSLFTSLLLNIYNRYVQILEK